VEFEPVKLLPRNYSHAYANYACIDAEKLTLRIKNVKNAFL